MFLAFQNLKRSDSSSSRAVFFWWKENVFHRSRPGLTRSPSAIKRRRGSRLFCWLSWLKGTQAGFPSAALFLAAREKKKHLTMGGPGPSFSRVRCSRGQGGEANAHTLSPRSPKFRSDSGSGLPVAPSNQVKTHKREAEQ